MQEVLLIEDSPSIRRLYEYNLTKSGYKVVLAADGEEALTQLKSSCPDVIVSDINMPRLDGFEFRAELLKHDEYKDIPFLFLTNRSSDQDTMRGLDLDADDYIVKTASPEVVIAKVRSLLRRRAAVKSTLTDELAAASTATSVQLVPATSPDIEGYDVRHWHQPHEGVPGGDFLDYVRLDDHRWLIVIADVMGKRWKAWMFAHAYIAYLRSTIRSLTGQSHTSGLTPGSILNRLNELLLNDDRTSEILCTVSLLLLNTGTNDVRLADAAHLPMLHYRAGDNTVQEVTSRGAYLGLTADIEYVDVNLTISHGDRLLLFTDGVTEAMSPDHVPFGLKAASGTFLDSCRSDIERTAALFQQVLVEYAGKPEYDDDLTLVCLQKQ